MYRIVPNRTEPIGIGTVRFQRWKMTLPNRTEPNKSFGIGIGMGTLPNRPEPIPPLLLIMIVNLKLSTVYWTWFPIGLALGNELKLEMLNTRAEANQKMSPFSPW